MSELTEDELLAQALAAMDSTPPGEVEATPEEPPEPPMDEGLEFAEAPPEPEFLNDSAPSMVDESPFAPLVEPQSLVLQELDANRRPKARTVCERCPNSVWFSSPTELKCYCRVMFLVTWSTKEPNQLTGCDGMFLGQE
ncbi:hypothetical protein SAMN04244573_02528 [Azotobacter beijerinckii]|uniref:TraH protein n=1 Tax=Azotobacter beijerinckii TaxID=170623 RepID=A0A1H9K0Q7_9GAMM|nr:hypothetical protein SAMN04244573_02528 [Azotobacter beijerinckii]